ncbi:MAG: hypothetical protein N838_10635 [Thiohalocapsa sp. PB-PSB1]|nr:MAG: hypothetical protein N838_10635 [Thiohalocapsa sp. PB-PSB1]
MPLFSCLLATSGAAIGALYSFLEQAPMRYFSPEDSKLMSDNIDAVLAVPDNDVPQAWHNDTTGNHGSAMSTRSFRHQNMNCRRLRIDNHASGVDARITADLCDVDGVWKVLRLPE